MALIHVGNNFGNAHGSVVASTAPLTFWRAKYPGVRGETEIRGDIRGRELSCEIMVFDNLTAIDAERLLARFEVDWVGNHGTLVCTPENDAQPQATYRNVTYMGFERDQSTPAPLLDIASTLDGGYWFRGIARFYQILPAPPQLRAQ